MPDQTITCPNCKTEFPLTASLAAPLLEATRQDFEARLAAKDAETAQREAAFKEREAALAEAQQSLDAQVTAQVTKERKRIAEEEAAKARAATGDEIAALQKTLDERNEKVAALQKGQAALAKQRQELEDAKNEFEVTIADKLREEREKIAADAERKARIAMQDDMAAQQKQTAAMQELLDSQRAKLAEAQQAQADLLAKQRELEDAKAEMALTIQKGIQEGLDESRAKARKEAEEALNLKLAESQHTIDGMKKQIEDLKRRAEQGSQQLQGEVLELELESRLGAQFSTDLIAPVPKGEFGGDVLQTVYDPLDRPCGKILWESKRTKAWSDGWLQKLKDDQRAAKAEIAVIVTQTLPKDVDTFDFIDGVWVTNATCAIPLAVSLRQSLHELALLRQTREGQETKMEAVYDYLNGPHFQQRVRAIVEAFAAMKDDLAKEKRAIQRQWAKREKQLERVLESTVGMYGDLQGIVGQSLQEISGLDLLEFDADPEDGEENDSE